VAVPKRAVLAFSAGRLARTAKQIACAALDCVQLRSRVHFMTFWTLLITLLACWNLFLHLRLSRESLKRRELAVAFRQLLVERRSLGAM
jgi:hypothetical protein